MRPLILILSLLIGSSSLADRAGNGGDFKEMEFISIAYDVLEQLKELGKKHDPVVEGIPFRRLDNRLRYLLVSFVDQAALGKQDRSGVNYPDDNEIEVTESEWDEKAGEYQSRFQFVLHELLPLIGVRDNGYVRSTPIVKELVKMGAFGAAQAKKQDNEEPVELYSEYWENDTEGLSYYDARQICALKKEKYDDQYFFVYCHYLEKKEVTEYKELEPHLVYDYFYSDDYTYESEQRYKWMEVSRHESAFYYGLKVFGWGDEAKSRWNVVKSSLNLGDGLMSRTFDTARKAYRACVNRLRKENASSPDYYKAKCRSPKVRNQNRYFYQIISKNPMLWEAGGDHE